MNWTHLVHDKVQWRDLASNAINSLVSHAVGNFLNS